MPTDIEVASAALQKIGEAAITALADVTIVEDTYAIHRDALLREHEWNFAIVRAALTRSLDTAQNITGATAANPVVITLNGHGYEDDDEVYIESVGGMTDLNDEYYTVDEAATNTFELKNTDGSDFTAYTSGGTAKLALDPEWGLAYAYNLPSGCLKVLLVDNAPDYDWRVEGAKIVTDIGEPLNIKYINQVTDPDDWDALFVDACIAKLAWQWSENIVKEPELATRMRAEYAAAFDQAVAADGQEGKTEPLPDGSWADAHV